MAIVNNNNNNNVEQVLLKIDTVLVTQRFNNIIIEKRFDSLSRLLKVKKVNK